jgi:hypothetical protein
MIYELLAGLLATWGVVEFIYRMGRWDTRRVVAEAERRHELERRAWLEEPRIAVPPVAWPTQQEMNERAGLGNASAPRTSAAPLPRRGAWAAPSRTPEYHASGNGGVIWEHEMARERQAAALALLANDSAKTALQEQEMRDYDDEAWLRRTFPRAKELMEK